jgi:signal transduction histidine kinase
VPRILRRFGIGLWSIGLGLVLVLVLGGLYAADRALRQADDLEASIEAVQAAAQLESFLAVQAQALTAFHALHVGPPAEGEAAMRERFLALVGVLDDRLRGFRRLWLTDSSGVVVQDVRLGSALEPLPAGLDLDTVTTLHVAEVAERARRVDETHVSPPGTILGRERGLVLLDPLYDRGRFLGFVGGSLSLEELGAAVVPRGRAARVRITPVRGAGVGGAAVVFGELVEEPDHPVVERSEDARVPGGLWRVEVAHVGRGRGVRVMLWALGLTASLALVVGVLQERRQTLRTAERSRELEHLSTELLRANKAKSEFLANVSHELRTPLNAIVGFVDLLKDGVYGELNSRQAGPVDRIAVSANHLRHLVDQVLDLGKIAAGRIEVHAEPVALRPFVFDVASEVEPLITEKGLTLSLAVGASLPRIRTDPGLLRQILVNLLGNAVKYTPTGGVAVRGRLVGAPEGYGRAGRGTRAESGVFSAKAPRSDGIWVAVQVVDTGVGISPTNHARVFEEFEQVDAGPRGDSINRGTGLGLTISRRLARLLGGEITLESELGKGSTFTLWLPVHPADLPADGGMRTPTGSVPIVQG